jgi:hypothetical protein
LTPTQRRLVIEALAIAESACQEEADALRRLVDQYGVQSAAVEAKARAKAANDKARKFDALRRELDGENNGKRKGRKR